LSFDLKDSSGICIVFNSTGSEFHNVGPETAKFRGPTRTVRVGGTARFPWANDEDRKSSYLRSEPRDDNVEETGNLHVRFRHWVNDDNDDDLMWAIMRRRLLT